MSNTVIHVNSFEGCFEKGENELDIEKLNKANELNRNIKRLSSKLDDFTNMLLSDRKLYLTDGVGKLIEIPEEAAYEIKRVFRQSIENPLNQYIKEFEEL